MDRRQGRFWPFEEEELNLLRRIAEPDAVARIGGSQAGVRRGFIGGRPRNRRDDCKKKEDSARKVGRLLPPSARGARPPPTGPPPRGGGGRPPASSRRRRPTARGRPA